MREIVLDTETTGLDPNSGDRVVEIGCVELINHIPSGEEWHAYLDPERDMPAEAYAVHKLSEEFLKGKPLFADVFEAFLTFIGDDRLIIHNASFDVGFLNSELARVGDTRILMDRVIDTLALARRKHPGSPNSLDALCKRYGVDASERTTHGAIIDCNLLASVYIELIGGHQAHLELASQARAPKPVGQAATSATMVQKRPAQLPTRLTACGSGKHIALLWRPWVHRQSGKSISTIRT